MGLKAKYELFVDEYMLHGNQTKAAIAAGYSEKTAAQQASRLMKIPEIAAEIADRRRKRHEQKTADADEVIEFYTAVMRGETPDVVPLMVGQGKQELFESTPQIRDRVAAAKELGRMYSLDKGISREDEQETSVKSFLNAVKPTAEEIAEVFDEED